MLSLLTISQYFYLGFSTKWNFDIMNSTLFSLAFVRVSWEKQRKDHIQNFVPLLGTLILEKGYKEIAGDSIPNISIDFQERFGINLPSHPLIMVMKRMTKLKYLSKSKGGWRPNLKKIKDLNITESAKDIEREFNTLVGNIQSFIFNKINETVELSVIEDGLIEILKNHDVEILFAVKTDSELSLLPEVQKDKKVEYLIGEFIKFALENDSLSLDHLSNISIGHALASWILIEDFQNYEGKLRNLDVYFDTPWLFDLIGTRCKEFQTMAFELLKIITQENATKNVWDVNVGELFTNLEICLEDFEKNRIPDKGSKTYKHCKENNISESDVHSLIAKFHDLLNEYGINEEPISDYMSLKEFQIDENELYDTITDTYSEKNIIHDIEEIDLVKKEFLKSKASNDEKKEYEKDKEENNNRSNSTIWRDVTSISGIYRERKGIVPRTLKNAKAIFVTTNNSLALASRRFEIKNKKTSHSIPSCVTDYFLGTLIWMNHPEIAKEVTRKKLISTAYAITQPDNELIKSYLNEIEKLKEEKKLNENEYLILRTHQWAYNLLNSKTYGDVNLFNPEMPYEILDQIMNEIKDGVASNYEELLSIADKKLKDEIIAKNKIEEERQNTLDDLKALIQQNKIKRKLLEEKSSRVATAISNIVIFLISFLLFWFSYKIYFGREFSNETLNLIISILLVLVGLTNFILGFTVKKFAQKLSVRIHHKIISFFD